MTTVEVLSFLVGLLAGAIATMATLVGLVLVVVVVAIRRAGAQGVPRSAQEVARQAAAGSRAARSPATSQES